MSESEKSPEKKSTEKKSADIVMLGRCPMCRKRATLDYRPFCSKRCSDLDLAKWLGGSYAIPAEETEMSEDDLNTPPHAD
jgi:endogenous inhibitor of DNA gyrase (YacG/DUF329 family)